MFSKACEYGIKAMIYIAQKSKNGERLSLKQIARETNSPEAFTAKVLQQLSKQNLLESLKGPTGGFTLQRPADQMNLASIVSAIDGDSIYMGCGLGLRECSEIKPCPLHHKFKVVRDELKDMLENTSLATTADDLDRGISFLRI